MPFKTDVCAIWLCATTSKEGRLTIWSNSSSWVVGRVGKSAEIDPVICRESIFIMFLTGGLIIHHFLSPGYFSTRPNRKSLEISTKNNMHIFYCEWFQTCSLAEVSSRSSWLMIWGGRDWPKGRFHGKEMDSRGRGVFQSVSHVWYHVHD